MGKGDIKTAKGKRAAGSYGVSRKRKKSKPVIESTPKVKKATTTAKKTTTTKTATKKTAAKKKK